MRTRYHSVSVSQVPIVRIVGMWDFDKPIDSSRTEWERETEIVDRSARKYSTFSCL